MILPKSAVACFDGNKAEKATKTNKSIKSIKAKKVSLLHLQFKANFLDPPS